MNYLLKLPFKYNLSLDERMTKEEQFSSVFKSIVEKYHREDININQNLVYSIIHDFNGSYIRLNIASPRLPKDMDHEIASKFSSVFINTPAYYDEHCVGCL
jgi:hypothetical protein